MPPTSLKEKIQPKVGDLRQYASVRRIILDDGPERNVRALAFSTGGGLDFWVLADRSLDVGPVWYCGTPMAWQSPAGFREPALHHPEADGGGGFDRSFSGFLVTCGLDHIRQPSGGDPLHGRLPFSPASVRAYGESWDRNEPVLFCEGEVTQWRYGAEGLRLQRRIEAPIGKREIRITDAVENLTSRKSRHQLLYHFNLGYPAISAGTEVRLGTDLILPPIAFPDPSGASESACHPSATHPIERCTVRSPLRDGSFFQTEFAFRTENLPWLQIWKDLRPRVGVLAIEPCTSEKIGRGQSGEGRPLEAGERREYHVAISLSGRPVPSPP